MSPKKVGPRRASPAFRDRAQDWRVHEVLIVDGICMPTEGTVITLLKPADFARVSVDDVTYQRHRTSEINDLILVLKNNGAFPSPIAIAVREDGSWWLVDGLQRFSAAVECQVAIAALFYPSTGRAAEAALYQALNTHVALTPDNIVKSHQGPGAALLRELATTEGHGLGHHVYFGGPGRRVYSAGILMRGLVAALTGNIANGKIQRICARADHAIRHPIDGLAMDRARAFFKLLPLVFPPPHPPKILPVHALGLVAHARWRTRIDFPTPQVYYRLSRLPWDKYFETTAFRYLPGLKEAIGERWK